MPRWHPPADDPARGRRGSRDPLPEDFEEHIVDIDVGEEMRTSFLEYAYSVIYSRALPDARDGLKPVQRRILHTMAEMGLRPDRGHVKSARVVGEVMGRLHPHGDGAIYDALVRMVQPWSLRLPMVDGHGNFGSPDEGPAAMRYTECRLAAAAIPMTASIDEDTVDFKPNYDSRETEPTVLPAALPNLLVNGAAGIAVGMATNMAPHNLVEVVQALRHLITHPNADLDALMRFIPGPDLPTGGKIIGLGGIRDAYETGRGTFKMRATVRVENVTPRRKGLVVTELPYGVGPEKVIERIKTLVLAKKLQGISDVKDLTDLANGLNLVIEVKNGFNPEAILEQLYRLTPMEDSFGINAVTLVDGQPRTLGLKELLEVYLAHRYDVVRRRSAYRRARAAERLHLVEGLLVAILDIDEVIQLIRSSDDGSEAKARLMSVFDLDDPQATYILDLQLRRLTRFSRIELEKEKDGARAADRRARRDPQRREQAARRRLRRAGRDREGARHPAPDRAAAVGRPAVGGSALAGGHRRPLLRVPVLRRAAGALAERRDAGLGRGAQRPRRDRLRRACHRPRSRRRRHDRGPGGASRRGRPAGAAADRQRPAPAGRRPAEHLPPARGRRARARADDPDRPGAGPRARHPAGRGQAGQPRAALARRVGGGAAGRRRRGRGGRRAHHGRGGALLRDQRRAAAALRRRVRCGLRAEAAAGSPASGWLPAPRRSSSAPSPSTRRRWSSPSPARARRCRAPSPGRSR